MGEFFIKNLFLMKNWCLFFFQFIKLYIIDWGPPKSLFVWLIVVEIEHSFFFWRLAPSWRKTIIWNTLIDSEDCHYAENLFLFIFGSISLMSDLRYNILHQEMYQLSWGFNWIELQSVLLFNKSSLASSLKLPIKSKNLIQSKKSLNSEQ